MSQNTSKYVHHLLLYECGSDMKLNATDTPTPGLCFPIAENDKLDYSPLWGNIMDKCQKISLAWVKI